MSEPGRPGGGETLGEIFTKLTQRGKECLLLAQQEARSQGHERITTAHVLQGILLHGRGIAVEAMRNLGVDLQQLSQAVRTAPRLEAGDTETRGSLTSHAMRAMRLAVEGQPHTARSFVGTDHLLLGLIGEGDGDAARILAAFGISHDLALGQITKLRGTPSPGTPFTVEDLVAGMVDSLVDREGPKKE